MKMRTALVFAAFLSAPAAANDCLELQASGDGVPAAYYQQKCLAEKAFRNKDYVLAATHYKNASAVSFFEAPNYRLRLEWAESLCLAGHSDRGLEILNSFILMAKADLGYFQCPEHADEALLSEHMHLACVGYGSMLTDQGKKDLVRDLERANTVQALCSNA